MSPAVKSVRRKRTWLRYLRAALSLAAALGAVPYSLRGHQVVFGAWKLPYHILSVFFLPVFGACAMIFPNNIIDNSFFFKFVFIIQYIPYFISMISFLICNIAYRSDLTSVNLKLLRIERMFFLMNVKPKIRHNFWHDVTYLLAVVCISVGHYFTMTNFDWSSVVMFVSLQYTNFFFFAFENIIMFFLDSIQHYLDMLVRRATNRETVLVKLCDIHSRLADVTTCIQKIYRVPVLFMAISSLAFINCNLCASLRVKNTSLTLIAYSWVTITFMLIYRISKACQQMKEKGKKFYVVLYGIMKKDKTRKLLENSYLRAHLLKKRSFSFNLAGLFEVDMKFVASMISATATYTVLLLQMGSGI